MSSLRRHDRRRGFPLHTSTVIAPLVLAVGSLGLLAMPAQAAASDVVINEVFSANTGASTDPNALRYDWVELRNTGAAPIDVNGWCLYDDGLSASKYYRFGASAVVPDSTTIPAGGYLVAFIASDPGLGKGDAVTITTTCASDGTYDPSLKVATTTWPTNTHANPSWARTSTGTYAMSSAATPGAANAFPAGVDDPVSPSPSPSPSPSISPMPIAPWPGLQAVTTLDDMGAFGALGSGGTHTDGNLSGLVFQPATPSTPAVLWGADNDLNPTLGNTTTKGAGAINKFVQVNGRWVQDPSDGWSWKVDGITKGGKQLHYGDGSGGVDSEGITVVNGSAANGVFIASERDNTNKNVSRPSILRYDVTAPATDTTKDGAADLSATNEWNLLPIINSTGVTLSTSAEANLGLEGVAWVPDVYLTAKHFRLADGSLYSPSTYGSHFGGLFLAALEKNGHIYAVALDENSNKATLVRDIAIPDAAVAAGFTVIQDLAWDADTSSLLAQCDNSCGTDQSAKLATYVIDDAGDFTITRLVASPTAVATQNTEGFAIAPLATATTLGTGEPNTLYRSVFWADDSVTDGYSLRTGYLTAGAAPSPSPSPSSSPNAQAISTTTQVGLAPTTVAAGTAAIATISVAPSTAGTAVAGTVRLSVDGTLVATRPAAPRLSIPLPAQLSVGVHQVQAVFAPSDPARLSTSTSAVQQLRVVKRATATAITAPKRAKPGKTVTVTVTTSARGLSTKPAGAVRVTVSGGRTATVALTAGKAVVKVHLPRRGKATITATYLGSSILATSSASRSIALRK